MNRSYLLATAAAVAFAACQTGALAQSADTLDTVVVTANRLAAARSGIQTQTGASTYTITADDIDNQPGGENTQLNQVILQAPGVAQDSFGQLHIRGEHNGLQYRINGLILPEGISVFGQTLDPRLAESVKLITGALPAEYGDRTAGVIDVETKSGMFDSGGEISLYGGSHNSFTPSIAYGGAFGSFNYFVSGDYTTTSLGIESPDGKSNPQHDRSQQYHGFGFLQDFLDSQSSLTAILGTSSAIFQIPNQTGLQPPGIPGIVGLGPQSAVPDGDGNPVYQLQANSQAAFPSENLDERQRELTDYAIVSYLHSAGSLDYQLSGFGRYSSLNFTPGANLGDLLYNGLAQTAYKRDIATGMQADGAWHLGSHTLRFGGVYQADDLTSRTSSLVLPTTQGDPANPACPDPTQACQTSTMPLTVVDNGGKHAWSLGVYVQDEWKLLDDLVLNYGLRFDQFAAFDAESQLSPRVNLVYTPTDTTTFHAGYSRYFSPPPFELVGTTDIALFDNTTAAGDHTDDTPKAERANYYDIGVEQKLFDTLTAGLDTFYKQSRNMIDEGQFGAPIILTPFNYARGRQYGAELTLNYQEENFSAYVNGAYERAVGEQIVSSQFQFDPDDLAYINNHYIPLDHQQLGSLSAGASYNWSGTRFSTDMLFGTGLRRDGATPNGDHVPAYVTVNFGVSHAFNSDGIGALTARLDVINAFDDVYEIRDGSGVGVGAPQFGARRGLFFGLSKSL